MMMYCTVKGTFEFSLSFRRTPNKTRLDDLAFPFHLLLCPLKTRNDAFMDAFQEYCNLLSNEQAASINDQHHSVNEYASVVHHLETDDAKLAAWVHDSPLIDLNEPPPSVNNDNCADTSVGYHNDGNGFGQPTQSGPMYDPCADTSEHSALKAPRSDDSCNDEMEHDSKISGAKRMKVADAVTEHLGRSVCFGWIKHPPTKMWRALVKRFSDDRVHFKCWSDEICEQVKALLGQEGITRFLVCRRNNNKIFGGEKLCAEVDPATDEDILDRTKQRFLDDRKRRRTAINRKPCNKLRKRVSVSSNSSSPESEEISTPNESPKTTPDVLTFQHESFARVESWPHIPNESISTDSTGLQSQRSLPVYQLEVIRATPGLDRQPWYTVTPREVCFQWKNHPGTARWLDIVQDFSENIHEFPEWRDEIVDLVKQELDKEGILIFLVFLNSQYQPCETFDGLWYRATPNEILTKTMEEFLQNRRQLEEEQILRILLESSPRDPPPDGGSSGNSSSSSLDDSLNSNGSSSGWGPLQTNGMPQTGSTNGFADNGTLRRCDGSLLYDKPAACPLSIGHHNKRPDVPFICMDGIQTDLEQSKNSLDCKSRDQVWPSLQVLESCSQGNDPPQLLQRSASDLDQCIGNALDLDCQQIPVEGVCFGWTDHPGTKRWHDEVKVIAANSADFPEWDNEIADLISEKLKSEGIMFLQAHGEKIEMMQNLGSRANKKEILEWTKETFLHERKLAGCFQKEEKCTLRNQKLPPHKVVGSNSSDSSKKLRVFQAFPVQTEPALSLASDLTAKTCWPTTSIVGDREHQNSSTKQGQSKIVDLNNVAPRRSWHVISPVDVCFSRKNHPCTARWRQEIKAFSSNRDYFPEWDNAIAYKVKEKLDGEGVLFLDEDCEPNGVTYCSLGYGALTSKVLDMTKERFLLDRQLSCGDRKNDKESCVAGRSSTSFVSWEELATSYPLSAMGRHNFGAKQPKATDSSISVSSVQTSMSNPVYSVSHLTEVLAKFRMDHDQEATPVAPVVATLIVDTVTPEAQVTLPKVVGTLPGQDLYFSENEDKRQQSMELPEVSVIPEGSERCGQYYLEKDCGVFRSRDTKSTTSNHGQRKPFDIKDTPLHEAARTGNHDAVATLLLDRHDDPNSQNNIGWTPLHEASFHGHDAVVALLLRHGANPNSRNVFGNSPLHHASLRGHERIADLLVENHADFTTTNENGDTPLHTASMRGYLSVVDLLLQHQSDPSASNQLGRTPLQVASLSGNGAVVVSLLCHKADPNAQDKLGETSLHLASAEGHEAVVELLLQYHADSNSCNKFGDTPLHVASSFGRDSIAALLLQYQACTNAVNTNGRTPLHMATIQGDKTVVDLLLRNDANPNAQDKLGQSALHFASSGGYEAVVSMLLQHNANPNTNNKLHLTPYTIAIRSGHDEIAAMLLLRTKRNLANAAALFLRYGMRRLWRQMKEADA